MEELCMYLNQQHRKFYSNDIKDDRLVPLFRQWAVVNFCVENVDFFLDVSRFKQVQNPSYIKQAAETIFNTYIAIGAPQEVNINYAIRVHTMRSLVEPTRKTFNEAQEHILELMEIDCFPRFFRSQSFTSKYRCVPDRLSDLPATTSVKKSTPVPIQEVKPRASSLKNFFKRVIGSQNTTRVRRSHSTFEAREHVVDMPATGASSGSDVRVPASNRRVTDADRRAPDLSPRSPDSSPRSPDSNKRPAGASPRGSPPVQRDAKLYPIREEEDAVTHQGIAGASKKNEGESASKPRIGERGGAEQKEGGAGGAGGARGSRTAHHRYSKSAPVVTVHLLGAVWKARREGEISGEGRDVEERKSDADGVNTVVNSAQSLMPNTSNVSISTISTTSDSISNNTSNNTSNDAANNTLIKNTSTNTNANNSSCITTASNNTIADASNSTPDITSSSSDVSNTANNSHHNTSNNISNDTCNNTPNDASNSIGSNSNTCAIDSTSNDSDKIPNNSKNSSFVPASPNHDPAKGDDYEIDFDFEFEEYDGRATMSKMMQGRFSFLFGHKTGTLKNGRHSAAFQFKYNPPKQVPKIGNQRVVLANASPPLMRRK